MGGGSDYSEKTNYLSFSFRVKLDMSNIYIVSSTMISLIDILSSRLSCQCE